MRKAEILLLKHIHEGLITPDTCGFEDNRAEQKLCGLHTGCKFSQSGANSEVDATLKHSLQCRR